ncbi:hypothetical protein [Amycolatopsis samaneae]|uniref:Membrane-associated oxidoreductase n=2 Tax=Amycolatopsis samaneae TaxID=664691 RepID=A0ABW5GFH9_9PSEU
MIERVGLTGNEARLWDAVTAGGPVDFDGEAQKLSATVLCHVLLSKVSGRDCRKLVVRNTVIVGEVDLESGKVLFPVEFVKCRFDKPVNLRQAQAPAMGFLRCRLSGIQAEQLQTSFGFEVRKCTDDGGISLAGAHVKGQVDFEGTRLRHRRGPVLLADGLRVDQALRCSRGFQAAGPVSLVGTRVGGQFECNDASFLNPGGVALEAGDLEVEESVCWESGFRAVGAIRLAGAHIKGQLTCTGGRFRNPGGVALSLSGAHVDQDVKLTEGSSVDGGVDFTGCAIGGRLELTGGTFRKVGGVALDLARASIDQNMICQSGFDLKGKILLAGAKVGGNLWCEGGKLDNGADVVIDATGLTVQRDVNLCCLVTGEGFRSVGEVVLSDAAIMGSLRCSGAHFINPGDGALTAKGLAVTRDALFDDGFVAEGEVDITDSRIGGRLRCTGGTFTHRARALAGERITVKQSAEFGEGFHADGTVSLRGAQIGGDLDFTQAELAGTHKEALILKGVQVTRTLTLRFKHRPSNEVDLCRASVARLDDREANWPESVRLYDFVYVTLPLPQDEPGAPSVTDRLDWLKRNSRYMPKVYSQLADAYRTAGLDDEAITVAVAGETARRAARRGLVGWLWRLLGMLSRWTVQYGYRPLKVLWWLLALQVAGAITFKAFSGAEQLYPRDRSTRPSEILYTLDLLLPVVNLKQRDLWIATGAAAWVSSGFIIAGWALALSLAVGVGRIFKSR